MTPNLLGLICLAAGCCIGCTLGRAKLWQAEAEARELRRDLAYAVGHPSVRGDNVVPLQGRRR